MDDSLRSVSTPPRTLQRKITSDFKSLSKGDKIQNVLKIYHNEEMNKSLKVDLKSNSVTTNQFGESRKVHKTFLFDSVSIEDSACEDSLISAIKRVAEKEDSFILSASRGLRKKSRSFNYTLLQTLVNWLLEYLIEYSEGSESKYSVRLSGLEIDEEMDTIKELGTIKQEDFQVTLENQHCYRCVDERAAAEIIKQFSSNSQISLPRQQYLYTIHLYQHTSHYSVGSSVSTQCSKIFLLLMDLTKQKNNENCLSPPSLAKLLMSSFNRNNEKIDIHTKFQKIIFDLSKKYAYNFTMVTQISLKEKHLSESFQLLQLASRIQRIKVKSKKNWENKNGIRPNRPTMGTNAFRKEEKYSDTEIASTSEISCAETVIFLGEERRRNSDDESRRFRSLFMSSDSDSGYRDWMISQSGGSRGTTPVNESKVQARPRTNALVWPKSALKLAKTVLLSGEELWVDGPNAFKKIDISKITSLTVSTSSTPDTVKQDLSPCCHSPKPIMVSQETQCDVYECNNVKKILDDIRPLSDISEVTEDTDTLRKTRNYQEAGAYTSPQSQLTSDEYSNLERNDVQNLSNWIHDVNEITSYQEYLTRSLHEGVLQNKQFIPVRNESVNSHSYQYYDPGSQVEYNSFPRKYPQIQYTQPNFYNPMTIRCCTMTPESEKEVSSPFNEKKTLKVYKKKESDLNKEKAIKTKSFSPLELLKKTLMRKTKKEILEINLDSQCSTARGAELMYLKPAVLSPGDSSDSTSSDSECNEWFRNVKSFKTKAQCSKTKCSAIRPPSAPLLVGSGNALRSQFSSRQRSSSSGYGSVITRDSEISSHHDSTSDQSLQNSLHIMKSSISFSHPQQFNSIPDELDPDMIAKKCEILVKQEKAFLLIKQQEMMVQDFYTSTRPLLTNDPSKYTLRVSAFDINRATADNQFLEELEEDTNIIRDSIAFYKSLVHLESSFITTPDASRRNKH